MKKGLIISLFVILAAAMLFTSCGGGGSTLTRTSVGSSHAAPTGTITMAIPDFGYESTDPIYQESLWGWMFYDSLIRWSKDNKYVPGVADSYTVSPDGLTWTFKIHQGIKFHNGDPLTAADVKFSVDRFGDMSQSSNPWSKYISDGYNKVSSTVIDDYTYQFVSKYPEPAQAIAFCWTRILPKKYFETLGQDEFRKAPIGSGPWKFKELVSKQKITLEANTDYWLPDEVPYYQYYVELMVPELATRISMLKTGDVDIAAVDNDRIKGLLDEGFAVEKILPPGTCSVFFQGSWLPDAGPVGNVKVRQAMSYALNRDEICKTIFAGYASPDAQFYMYPGCYGWSDALKGDPYDVQKAKDLLKEANYPAAYSDPEIHIFTTSFMGFAGGQDLALLLDSYWKAVGLQIKVEVVDLTVAAGYIFQGFFGAPIKEGDPNVGWMGMWNYQSVFNAAYQAANMFTPGGAHCVSNDTHAKELYDKSIKELDLAKAEQYWNDFMVYVKSTYINIGICETDNVYVYNPKTLGKWAGRIWTSYWDALNGVQHP